MAEISTKLASYENARFESREIHLNSLAQNNELVISSLRYASQLQSRINSISLAESSGLLDPAQYDYFLISRYDIGFRGGYSVRYPVRLSHLESQWLIDNTKNRYVLPIFDQLNCGYPDMWFYLNRKALINYKRILSVYVDSLLQNLDALVATTIRHGGHR